MSASPLIDVISMGCSKNLVDSEQLLKRLETLGYTMRHDPENPKGDYVVVNTCGFIQDAKEESIQLILELAELKKNGKIGQLIVMGCLSQRYMDELKEELPEVDKWYGKFNWKEFIDELPAITLNVENNKPKSWERHLTTPPFSAFLKISEGCNRFCSFCAIPIITGRHTSRPIEEILEEVNTLVAKGVKEFNIIAQDLSSYGLDLYGEKRLPLLIDRMAQINGGDWIRLHYAYPADFPTDVLDVMAKHKNVCNYIDIALQHISNPVLKNMRRHINTQQTRELIKTMRQRVPGIRIRTTLMVGFPGEDEKAFEELINFVREVRFDRMGAFAYSEEDDTWAAKNLNDTIPAEIKQQRLDKLMSLQEDISQNLHNEMVGKSLRVLVVRNEGDDAIARSEYDSPDVDPEIIIKDCNIQPGEFINVVITEAYPFELIAYPE